MAGYIRPEVVKQGLHCVIEHFGVEVLTNALSTEGKILVYLGENGPSRVKEVMVEVDASYRGFYLALERLKGQGLVNTSLDSKDKRVRILSLAKV